MPERDKFSEFPPVFKVELESSEATARSAASISREIRKISEFLYHYLALLIAMQKVSLANPPTQGLIQAAGAIEVFSAAAGGPQRVLPPNLIGKA